MEIESNPKEGMMNLKYLTGALALSATLALSGCVTLSGSYKVSLQTEADGSAVNGVEMQAEGSGIYTAINALCLAHPGATVVIRDITTGAELKGESPHKCR